LIWLESSVHLAAARVELVDLEPAPAEPLLPVDLVARLGDPDPAEVVGEPSSTSIALSWTWCPSDSSSEAASRTASADTPRMGALWGPPPAPDSRRYPFRTPCSCALSPSSSAQALRFAIPFGQGTTPSFHAASMMFWAARRASKRPELAADHNCDHPRGAEHVRHEDALRNPVDPPAVPKHEEPPRPTVLGASGGAAGVELRLTASSRTGLSASSRWSRLLAPRSSRPRPKRGCAGQTRRGLDCRASAARRFAADREQRRAALGAVALPAGTTVGQGHLARVGDVDLFAADAPGLRTGLLSLSVLRAPLTHARQPYSRLACLSCGAGSPPAFERKVCA
jgi:hypothetical protein